MQTCPDCKETKPDSEFYKNKNTARGLTHYCKLCLNKRSATYKKVRYHTDPDYKKTVNAKYTLYWRTRYHTDPQFRQQELAEQKELYKRSREEVQKLLDARLCAKCQVAIGHRPPQAIYCIECSKLVRKLRYQRNKEKSESLPD